MNKVLLVGSFNSSNLESSYLRSAQELNLDVVVFDCAKTLDKYVLFGKIGRYVKNYIEIQAWTNKMNREFVIKAKELAPDIIMLFCNANISPSAILFLKSVLKRTKFVLVWPDSLNNFQSNILQMAGMMDLMASYSSNSLPYLNEIGFKHVSWIPLAGDIQLHYKEIDRNQDFSYDISFVGNWRLEREQMLVKIVDAFKDKRIGIFGPSWKKYATSPSLKNLYVNRNITGLEMTDIFQKSKVNLNKIDDTNFPAANMRFFEIPIAGGLMLSSECPEMENIYKENESVLYFRNDDELIEKINIALKMDTYDLRVKAQTLTKEHHNYTKRLESIISILQN